MSAERLRQAAALLRERAEAATPGRWYADYDYGTITAEPFKSAREAYDRDYRAEDDMFTPFVISESDGGGGFSGGDGAYIALMAPPVALALADWLEDHAINADYWAQELAANPDSDPMRFIAGDSADRLANAILGDAS